MYLGFDSHYINCIIPTLTTFSGLQQISDRVNSSTKKAADAKTRGKHRVTPPDLTGRQRVGPNVIEDDTPELTDQVEDMIQNKGRKDARTENANVVQDRTFNRPVERNTHRYPTRNLIQPVQTLGLELPDKRHGKTLNGQPEEIPETTMEHTGMPPFLINTIIDDEDGEIDLEALIHGVEILVKQVNAVTCPKT